MSSTNIRVAVRTRPLSSSEESRGSASCVTSNDRNASVTIANPDGKATDAPKTFTYDFSYGSDSTQPSVYSDLGAPLIGRALDGYNGTIFAYGQTGSGKTWTMMGSPEDEGIIPRLNRDLFGRIAAAATTATDDARTKEETTGIRTTTQFMVTASYIEIYNEIIRDLLNPSDLQLAIRETPDGKIFVQGVCEVVCKDEFQMMKLISQGSAIRRVAATQMNQQSSRSHSVFMIKVEKLTTEVNDESSKETLLTAKLNLVDLAGSERADKTGATGDTMKEGISINKSLMALGNVINSLVEAGKSSGKDGGKHHIPYRDSKLTRILQESLGGNASTLMIAALSPAAYNYAETLGTLNYAKRAKLVENKVERNEDVNEKLIRQLKEEIEALRAQLTREAAGAAAGMTAADGGGGGGGVGGGGGGAAEAAVDPALVERLKELESSQHSHFEEKERLSRELEIERSKNVQNVMGAVIDGVKEKKMGVMKAIKKLQSDQKKNAAKQQQKRDEFAAQKASLENDMQVYSSKQAQFDAMPEGPAKDAKEEELSDFLDAVEKKRGVLQAIRNEMRVLKEEEESIENQLMLQRADLVANAEILEQNDSLRKAIVEEERAKFESMKEEYLAKSLEDERAKIEAERERLKDAAGISRKALIMRVGKLQVESKPKPFGMDFFNQNKIELLESQNKELDAKNTAQKKELEVMELRVVESESAVEEQAEEILGLGDEVKSLKEALRRKDDELQQSLSREREVHEDNSDNLVIDKLMEGFDHERREVQKKYDALKQELSFALKDLLFLNNMMAARK